MKVLKGFVCCVLLQTFYCLVCSIFHLFCYTEEQSHRDVLFWTYLLPWIMYLSLVSLKTGVDLRTLLQISSLNDNPSKREVKVEMRES